MCFVFSRLCPECWDQGRKTLPILVSEEIKAADEESAKDEFVANQRLCVACEQFRLLVSHLREPFGTMALVCICFGLRISECLALKWSDVDGLNGRLRVERGIVEQNVDDVKTDESRKSLAIAGELLERLKVWKQTTQFPADGDWIFASPLKLGRLPHSYTGFWRELDRAGKAAGIGHLGTHTFRHSYRTWLDSVGTPVGVQQRLMRHSDIRMTMQYGDALTDDMKQAHGKIVQLAVNGR